MVFDRRVLLVGADLILAITPQVVHGIEFRRALGQPDQFDPQPLGQMLRADSRVAWVLIQQQGDVPTPVMPMKVDQERLEVPGSLPFPGQKQASPGPEVQASEDNAAGVPAREWYLFWSPAQRPSGPKGRKEQQVGLVFGQQDAAGRQMPDTAADPPFFFTNSGSG